jgi:GNAT superfamily N-acetyltransferase
MILIENLTASDLAFGMQLSTEAGWNQTPADWRRFLSLSPDGCFVAKVGGQRVGTVTTCQFGAVAWIGMMLVDPAWRRQGIGRALMQRALDHVASRGTATVRLDATPQGAPLYVSLGFTAQYRLHRFAGIVRGPLDAAERDVRGYRACDRNCVCDLDLQTIGYDRSRLLDALWADDGNGCLVSERRSQIQGYLMYRPGTRAVFVGPCLATEPAFAASLLSCGLAACAGQQVFIDVPESNSQAAATVEPVGLQPVRELLRMIRGNHCLEVLSGMFASSGPEKG